VLDNVLPEDLVREINQAFPPVTEMRLMSTFRERKYTSRAVDRLNALVGDALFAFQTPEVVEIVAKITGMKGLLADPSLYAGGISSMTQGQYLNPHLDNSHNLDRSCYRRLNLLFYVTPNWSPPGGATSNCGTQRSVRPPKFRACSTGW